MPVAAASVLEAVKELYDNPDKFIEIALSCNTAGVDAKIHDWFKKFPNGMFVTEIKFTEDYLRQKPQESFVRAMLADASMCEGRGRDIFRGVPREGREKLLREKYMEEYITPKELRLEVPDLSVFLKLFTEYAEKNNIPADKRERQFYRNLSADLRNAAIIELGGSDGKDHLYYSSKGGMVYIINLGEWK